jgi:HD-GYP domain-containing protein (c-di-GMP phosphodiesterase class II)
MADMAEKIAREKGMSEDEIISLRYAAILHDIGEILLPRNLLKTSEKLDEENLFLLRTHPLLGELQLRNKDFPYDEVPTLVRWHHERFDGTGYPDSLKGEEIPLSCRILALVDAVSAMKEERPYRKKAMKMNEIVKELDLKSGIQFDPELVEIWKMLFLKAQTGGEN